MAVKTFSPASDKQVAFLDKLLVERDVPLDFSLAARANLATGGVSKAEASKMIDTLLKAPKYTVPSGPSKPEFTPVEPGHYMDPEGTVFEVVKAKTSDRTYAKSLVVTTPHCGGHYRSDGSYFECGKSFPTTEQQADLSQEADWPTDDYGCLSVKPKGKWTFVPGAMKNSAAWVPITLAEAVQFGKKVGVCCMCGRTLTVKASIEAGIGPICQGKF